MNAPMTKNVTIGHTTQRIAELVGPTGEAMGVDAAARFIETARAEAAEAGVANARFEVADVQTTSFDERFDLAFSRMGTMFFANPVPAMRNVRQALVPGGRLVMVVWRRRIDKGTQRLGHCACRLKPIGAILGHHLLDDRAESGRKIGTQLT